MQKINIDLDSEELSPLIRRITAEVLTELRKHERQGNGKLAFREAEAARLIGLNERQLADERRRGRISSSQIVVRRIRYTQDDLLAYLNSRRYEAESS